MLILNVISKNLSSLRSCKIAYRTLTFLSSELRELKPCVYSEMIANPFSQNKFKFTYKNFSNQAFLEKATDSKAGSSKSPFQQMLHFRKKQAQCSVLLQVESKDDIPYAISSCEKFGVVKNVYSYKGESENVFILLEFDNKDSACNLLLSSTFKNISDAFPVLSRIVGFSKNKELGEPNMSVNVKEDSITVLPAQGRTVSDLIENIYMFEKLTELNVRLRFLFCCIVKELLSGPFPLCDAIPFGSSVNGTGKRDCDLDLVIRLYPEKINSSEFYLVNKICIGDIQNLQKRVVYCISNLLQTFSPGVTAVKHILHARVPIVKLQHRILGIKADISVNNLASVLMSELLYFWGEVDPRTRPLIYAVKKWARESGITNEAPGSWITNFALTLLVVFFLQNRSIPILPPMIKSVNIKGVEFSEEYKLEYLAPLLELQTKASLNKEPLDRLLVEFLTFLGSHPFENKYISLHTGIAKEEKTKTPIHVQYPFQEDLNVSKNVSEHELWDMCENARVSAQYLSSSLNQKSTNSRDFSALLGIPHITKLGLNKSKRIDVSLLIGEENNKKFGRRRGF